MDIPSMTWLERVPICPREERVFRITAVLEDTMAAANQREEVPFHSR